jgi:hypothetical protein
MRGRFRPRYAKADATTLPEFALDAFDQAGNGHQCRHIVTLRCRDTAPDQFAAIRIERDDLDFGPAKVDPKARY